MTPERALQKAICEYLTMEWPQLVFWRVDSVGIFDPIRKAYRSNRDPYKIKGVSDIIGINTLTGLFIAIEVKTKTGRVSPDQKWFIDRINASGGLAFVARSIDDVERKLNEQYQK